MAQPQDIAVGEEIPTFQRKTGLHNWNRYAAVNYEFVLIHMEDEAGRAAGMATAFGMGNLQWAYMHNMLRDWLGDSGRILSMGCQFRSPNLNGQTVTAHGVVTAVREENGQRILDFDVYTEDEEGNKLAPGNATVVVDA